MKLVTTAEMRQIEIEANQNGLAYETMMENAGLGLAKEINILVPKSEEELRIIGLVGSGNNGGDTLIALAHLAGSGWKVCAYIIKRETGDVLLERLKKAGGEVVFAKNDEGFSHLSACLEKSNVVIDGILGTGVKLPLTKEISSVLNAVNHSIGALSWPPYVVAVDCPSGVNCDSGEVADEVIPASITVCMAAVKQGLLKFPAFEMVGEIRSVDIGLDGYSPVWENIFNFVADEEMVLNILPERPADSHKGTFGTALVVGGSINYIGAPQLAGKAAYRCGAGLVQLAVPAPVQHAIAGQLLEATWVVLPHELGVIAEDAAEVLMENLGRATSMLLGPGLGTDDTTKHFIQKILSGKASSKKPAGRIGFTHSEPALKFEKNISLPRMVVDADGLRLLAGIEKWSSLLPEGSVLTPHPGEMAALTGMSTQAIQADRRNIALQFARDWGQVVVLKGAFTVVASADGRSAAIPVATSALARAGTGDVLAGLIAGLMAQGVGSYESAVAGAWIHAQAGLYAAEKLGSEAVVMAGDVLDAIVPVYSSF